jgi:hypothetical protein
MKKEIFCKSLVIGILVILVGVGVYPAVADVSISQKSSSKYETMDAKAFLFQTVIDTLNNPRVKELLERSNDDDFESVLIKNVDSRHKIKKIIFENFGLFVSMFFTKPSISQNYLDNVYDNGVRLINSIGTDKTLGILESLQVSDHELMDGLDEIIKNDEMLSEQVYTLEEMNTFGSDQSSWPFPLICTFLLINWLYLELFRVFLQTFCTIFDFIPFMSSIYSVISAILNPIISIFDNLGGIVGCFWI